MTVSRALPKDKQQVFDTALETGIERDNLETIDLALNQGADPDILLPAGIERRNMDWITRALDKGANPETLLFEGIHFEMRMGEAFHYAASCAWEKLKEYPTTPDSPNHWALDFVTTAVRYGAKVTAGEKDDQGTSYPALHWAYKNFRSEVSDFLIAKGADVDTLSPAGNTPLMRAVSNGESDLVVYYLGKGADPMHPCGEQKADFPLKALERSDKFRAGKKAELLQLMMQHIRPAPAEPAPQAETPAPSETGPAKPEAANANAPAPEAAGPSVALASDVTLSKPALFRAPQKPGRKFDL